jgi:hypothetical protein
MTTTTKQKSSDIAGCVTILAEAFGKTATAAMFKAYELGLRGLTSEQVKFATQQALEQCRFMPPPAELRELIYLKPQDRAVKAWLVFERAVVANGCIRSVTFDDPLINATVRALGGWEHCCSMPAAEFDTFLQKRFQETYCSLSRAGVSAEQAAPLVGWFDRQNALNGYDPQPLALIETGLPQTPAPRIGQTKPYERPANLPRLELKKA